jgi:FemAB-related protein (PEP-CTERM system-associated)
MAVTLHPLEERSAPAWDAFVAAMPAGTFFHRAAWARVIEAAFGHRTCYVLAERDGAVVGVLPLAQVKTWLFGNTLISVPFCVYGGPLAADVEARAALEAHAIDLLRRTGAEAVEFRERDAMTSDWQTRDDLYVTFRKPLAADHERNMKAIPRKQRAMVRKGIQNGLVSVVGQETEPLHRIYAESVRNLGTPVFSRRYFALLLEAFRDSADVVTIVDDGQPIAAVLNFYPVEPGRPY